jgi:nitroreductase
MEFCEVLESRRSIRKYKNEDIDDNVLLEAIKYGIMSPSAHNRQPWKVKVVKRDEKDATLSTQ